MRSIALGALLLAPFLHDLRIPGTEVGRLSWLALALAGGLSAGVVVLRRGDARLDLVGLAALAFTAVTILSFARFLEAGRVGAVGSGLTFTAQLLFMVAVYIAVVAAEFPREMISRTVGVWLAVAATAAAFVVAEAVGIDLVSEEFRRGILVASNPGQMRSTGFFFTEPAVASTVLAGPTVYSVHAVTSGHAKFRVGGPLAALLLVAVAATASVSGWLTVGISLLVVAFASRDRTMALVFVVSALAGIYATELITDYSLFSVVSRKLGGIFALLGGHPTEGIQAYSVLRRMAAIEVGLSAWLDRPILGVGVNALAPLAERYAPAWYPYRVGSMGGTHNIWVQTLAQAGIIGAVMLGVLWYRVYRTARATRRVCREESWWTVIVVLFIGSLFNLPIIHPLYWSYFAVGSLILQSCRTEPQYA